MRLKEHLLQVAARCHHRPQPTALALPFRKSGLKADIFGCLCCERKTSLLAALRCRASCPVGHTAHGRSTETEPETSISLIHSRSYSCHILQSSAKVIHKTKEHHVTSVSHCRLRRVRQVRHHSWQLRRGCLQRRQQLQKPASAAEVRQIAALTSRCKLACLCNASGGKVISLLKERMTHCRNRLHPPAQLLKMRAPLHSAFCGWRRM